jgi:DNA topoisomerase I
MTLDTITLDEALRLLTLPRLLGVDPDTAEPIEATNGRYGPYLRRAKESRSLETEEQLFTVTLDDAVRLLREPKARGRRTAAAPLRELGADTETSRPVVVKNGRFGPYVTDGEVNATLRRGDDVETVTLERAAELLAEKRAKGPAPPQRTKKTPAKRAPKKSAASTRKAPKKRAAKSP